MQFWRRVLAAVAASDGINKVDVTAEAFGRCRSGFAVVLEALLGVDDRAAAGEARFEARVVRFAQAWNEIRRLEKRRAGHGSSLRSAKGAALVLSDLLSRRVCGLEELRLREFWQAEGGDSRFVSQLSSIVSRNRSLQKLEVACTFTSASLAGLLSAVAHHPRLAEVEIGARATSDDVVDDQGAVAALVSTNRMVRKLTLYDDPLSHAGFYSLCGALVHNNALRSLTLGFAGGEGASPALARLCEALTTGGSRLTTLHIADCGLPASRLVELFADALPSMRILRELKVGFFRVGPSAARLAHALAANASLAKLVVWTVPRDLDSELETVVDLSIDDSVVLALADALAHNTALKELTFDNCDVSDRAAAALVDVLLERRNKTLQALDFDLHKLEPSGALAKFAKLLARPDSNLRSLSLRRGSLVGDDGASTLAAALDRRLIAGTTSGLTALDLGSCGLTDAAANALARALRSRSCPLADLSLTHNNIGDDGARQLATALCAAGNTTLARLDLSYNDIDPDVTAFHSAEAFADHFNRTDRHAPPPSTERPRPDESVFPSWCRAQPSDPALGSPSVRSRSLLPSVGSDGAVAQPSPSRSCALI